MIKLNDEAINGIAEDIVFGIKGDWQIKDGWENGTPGHEKFWNDFVKRVDPHEKKYKETVFKILQEQAKEVFENIEEYPNIYTMWGFDTKKSFRALADAEAKFITQLYKQEGQKAIDLALKLASEQRGFKAEVGIVFDLENPRAISELEKRTQRFATGIVGTTESEIRQAIRAGIKEGETYEQIADRVQDKLGDGHLLNRAMLIARTEGIYAANAGAELGYIQSGVVEGKQWLIAWDEKTCDACQDMEGMTAPLGEPTWEKEGLNVIDVQGRYGLSFDYTEGTMPFPPLHPRCRCTIVPILKRISKVSEAQGVREKIVALENKYSKEYLNCKTLRNEYWEKAREARKLGDINLSKELYRKGADNSRRMMDIKSIKRIEIQKMTKISDVSHKLFDYDLVGGTEKQRKMVKEAIDETSKYMKKGLVNTKKSTLEITISPKKGRSYYSAGYGDDNIVLYMGGTVNDGKTAMHEIGHFIENNDDIIGDLVRGHYASRTKGIIATPMKNIMNELSKKDKFLEEYMGKVSGGSNTEILSCSLPIYATNPEIMAMKDAETFDFIYNLLRGI